jgi:ankyrin repeat protein
MDILSEIKIKFEIDKLQNIINQQSKNGSSPLLVASEKGNSRIIRLLLASNARTDIFNEVYL